MRERKLTTGELVRSGGALQCGECKVRQPQENRLRSEQGRSSPTDSGGTNPRDAAAISSALAGVGSRARAIYYEYQELKAQVRLSR